MIDYGAYTTTNRDPETGIRYGMISLNSLVDIDYELMNLPNPNLDEQLQEYALHRLLEMVRDSDIAPYELDCETLEEAVEAIHDTKPEDLPDLLESHDPNALQYFWDGVESTLVGAEGEIYGVKVKVTELGGALMLWVFDSPHTGWYAPCSPCVPGAGDLDAPIRDDGDLDFDPSWGGVLTYDVPADWRDQTDI